MGTSVVLFLIFDNVGVIFYNIACLLSFVVLSCLSFYALLCYVSIDITNNQGRPKDKESNRQTKQNSKVTKKRKRSRERNKEINQDNKEDRKEEKQKKGKKRDRKSGERKQKKKQKRRKIERERESIREVKQKARKKQRETSRNKEEPFFRGKKGFRPKTSKKTKKDGSSPSEVALRATSPDP